jgi:hypothetical protein
MGVVGNGVGATPWSNDEATEILRRDAALLLSFSPGTPGRLGHIYFLDQN